MAMAKNAAAKKNPELIPKKRLPNPDPSTARAKKPAATANYRGSGMGPTAYASRKIGKVVKEYNPKYFTPAEYDALMAKQAKARKLGDKAQKAGKAQAKRRTTRSADPTPGRAPGR